MTDCVCISLQILQNIGIKLSHLDDIMASSSSSDPFNFGILFFKILSTQRSSNNCKASLSTSPPWEISKGSFKNYITQNFWTLTYCSPVTHTPKCAYQEVTVRLCLKVLCYVIFKWPLIITNILIKWVKGKIKDRLYVL